MNKMDKIASEEKKASLKAHGDYDNILKSINEPKVYKLRATYSTSY